MSDEPSRLLEIPADELPLDEAQKLLDSFGSEIEQLSAAARCSDCDWQYVIDQGDPLLIALPDAQFLRSYARLLSIRARYEARRGNFASAIEAIQDDLMLGQHAAKGPFLVNRLIGYTISSAALEQVDVFLEQRGAPNLYWALACLPGPLVSFESRGQPGKQHARMEVSGAG